MENVQPSAPTSTTATSKATASLIRNQEKYCERLDSDTDKLIENFFGILKASKINRVVKAKPGDKAGRTRNDFVQTAVSDNQIELRSTNMVAAAEDLQQLINDLKQSVILSDFAQLNKDVSDRNQLYNDELRESKKAFVVLCDQIDSALVELESAYFSSRWKLPPPSILASEEDLSGRSSNTNISVNGLS